MEKSVKIPFAGFYNSDHDAQLDSAVEQMMADESGDPRSGLVSRITLDCQWIAVFTAYAKAYAVNLAEAIGVKFEFEELDSPKDYFYGTDCIHVKITLEELQRMYDETDRAELSKLVMEELSPRSGFIPFFSNNLDNWPKDLAQWQEPQLGLLMACYVSSKLEMSETDLMEPEQTNGKFENWIESNTASIERIYKIKDYLNQREARH